MESLITYFLNLCKKNPLLAIIALLLGGLYLQINSASQQAGELRGELAQARLVISQLNLEVRRRDSTYTAKTDELRNQAHQELKEFFASKEKQYEEQLRLVQANTNIARKIRTKSDATIKTVDKVLKQLEDGK